MATRLHLRRSGSAFLPNDAVLDLTVPAGTGATTGANDLFMTTGAGGQTEQQWTVSGGGAPLAFVSERFAAGVTISGAITVQVYAYEDVGGAVNGTIRVRLFKVTAGGSNVETLIGSAQSTTRMVVETGALPATQYTLTVTPAVAVSMVAGERLVLRVYAIPVGATLGPTTGASLNGLRLGAASAGEGYAYLELTETITFTANATRLLLRRTQTAGIGNFYDATAARGSSTYYTSLTRVDANITVPLTITTIFAANPSSNIQSTANATTYASGAFTPKANYLYLLAVVHSDAAPEATVPTVTNTQGLTFVQVGSSMAFDTIASNVHRLTLFRAMKPSGLVNGAFTVTLADAATGVATILLEISGVDTSGTDGANALRNIVTNAADATSNPSVTFGAFAQTYNGVVLFTGTDIATQPTVPNTTWNTQHPFDWHFSTYATPTTSAWGQWRHNTTSLSTTVNATLATSDWAAIGVELVAVPPTVLAYISPRIKNGFTYEQGSLVAAVLGVWAYEYDIVSDASVGFTLSRWRAGVETVCSAGHLSGELGTTAGAGVVTLSTLTNGTVTTTHFLPDDRILVRLTATMGSGLATQGNFSRVFLELDHNIADARGDSYLDVYAGPTFKADADPNEVPDIVSGLMMGGVGN